MKLSGQPCPKARAVLLKLLRWLKPETNWGVEKKVSIRLILPSCWHWSSFSKLIFPVFSLWISKYLLSYSFGVDNNFPPSQVGLFPYSFTIYMVFLMFASLFPSISKSRYKIYGLAFINMKKYFVEKTRSNRSIEAYLKM